MPNQPDLSMLCKIDSMADHWSIKTIPGIITNSKEKSANSTIKEVRRNPNPRPPSSTGLAESSAKSVPGVELDARVFLPPLPLSASFAKK